jgi:hypothetical protein
MEVQADTQTAVISAKSRLVVVMILRGLRVQIFQCETFQRSIAIVALGRYWQPAVPCHHDAGGPMQGFGCRLTPKITTAFLIRRLGRCSFLHKNWRGGCQPVRPGVRLGPFAAGWEGKHDETSYFYLKYKIINKYFVI